MAQSTGKPAKKAPAKKAAARPARAARTASQPVERTQAPADVEDQAVVAAAAAPAKRARAPRRAAAAAAAMRAGVPADTPTPAPPADEAAEGDEAAEPGSYTDGLNNAVVPFHGRDIAIRMPTEEQLVMYQRLSRQFQQVAARKDEVGLDEALTYLDRAVTLLQSIMVDQGDKTWLEDALLLGDIKLMQCRELLVESFRLLALANSGDNRETRRAAAKRARLAD